MASFAHVIDAASGAEYRPNKPRGGPSIGADLQFSVGAFEGEWGWWQKQELSQSDAFYYHLCPAACGVFTGESSVTVDNGIWSNVGEVWNGWRSEPTYVGPTYTFDFSFLSFSRGGW
jgi:hypothetical protein